MNSFALEYNAPDSALLQYAQPTGLVVTGRTNYNDPAFQAVRAGGGEVYRYLCVPEAAPALKGEEDFYDPTKLTYWEPRRANYTADSFLTDLTRGTVWNAHVIEYTLKIARTGKFDGVFYDAFAARYWSARAAWETWPATERERRILMLVTFLQDVRAALNAEGFDAFKIVINGQWTLDSTIPVLDSVLAEARLAADGCMIEHKSVSSSFQRLRASQEYSALGQRRVLWLGLPGEEGVAVAGATHYCYQPSTNNGYGTVLPPSVGFTDLRPQEYAAKISRQRDEIAVLAAERDELEDEATNLATRITEISLQLASAQDRIATLTSERDAAEAEIISLSSECNQLLRDVEAVTTERNAALHIISDVRAALQGILNT